jgi:sodium-dependent dicarboxylate transporter 2/3/5
MSRFCCSQLQVVCKKKRGIWSVVAGPLAMLVILTCVTIAVEEEKQGEGEGEEERSTGKKVVVVAFATRMLGVVVWMAMWWVLEPVPLCITALLPLALFPFCNLMNADAVARQYWNDTMSLMLGTFILSLGIQKYQLHKRMALRILLFFGGDKMDPRLVLLSFVVAPAFVSMWVSNAAASIMMIPMATGVLKHLDLDDDELEAPHGSSSSSSFSSAAARLCTKCSNALRNHSTSLDATSQQQQQRDEQERERELRDFFIRKVKKSFAKAVVLGITFATAIGGMATINGSGPNMVLAGVYSEISESAASDILAMDVVRAAFHSSFSHLRMVAALLTLVSFLCNPHCGSSLQPQHGGTGTQKLGL